MFHLYPTRGVAQDAPTDGLQTEEPPHFHAFSPELNAKCREKGLAHVTMNPFAMLVIFRQLYEPIRMLTVAKMHMFSDAFDLEEEAAAARARLICFLGNMYRCKCRLGNK